MIEAFLFSPTFWRGCISWFALAICLGGVLIALTSFSFRGWRQGTKKEFWTDDSGSVPSIEMLLIAPIYFVLVSVIVQFLLLAEMSLTLHQAAYSAARSARVHSCPPLSLRQIGEDPQARIREALRMGCTETPERWTTAAQIILVSASPSSFAARERQSSGCRFPDAFIELHNSPPLREGLVQALRNKACYAFEPENVKVAIEWASGPSSQLLFMGIPPVTAQVTFRYPILTPSGMLLADERRLDGTRWRQGRAVVTLL